jgi:hypothetical protein
MARKNKKRTTSSQVDRAPIVNIRQRDEKLAQDLQNLNQKDAIKYSNHLMHLVSGDPEFIDLIFNIPELIHYLKKYEMEKKPGLIKSKLFKAGFAKAGAEYLLPLVVDGPYITKAKGAVMRKFNANPTHEDKMALAIARASLEMHGKVVQGKRIPIQEVPLFHIALSASLEIIQKISKGDKKNKDETDRVFVAGGEIQAIFPRWQTDQKIYHKNLENEVRNALDESFHLEIFSPAITAGLEKLIYTEIQKGEMDTASLAAYIDSKKMKSEMLSRLSPLARQAMVQDLVERRNVISKCLEKNLHDNFSEKIYTFFAYLFFIASPDVELLLPIYINQALLNLKQKNFNEPKSNYFLDQARSAKGKETELMNLMAAFSLGETNGEHIFKIAQLLRDLELNPEARNLYRRFLDKPESEKDEAYKKIKREWEKNYT